MKRRTLEQMVQDFNKERYPFYYQVRQIENGFWAHTDEKCNLIIRYMAVFGTLKEMYKYLKDNAPRKQSKAEKKHYDKEYKQLWINPLYEIKPYNKKTNKK
jgi:hypothetical protein